MTNMKTLSAVIILSAAVAAPVSARDGRLDHLGTHWRQHHFRDAFNQRDLRLDRNSRFQGSTEEFRDRDASRIGGEDPSRHPTAY
jgi:hypothetical protein